MLEKYRNQAGVLPGEAAYIFDRLGDWIRINLMTLSTKQKQAKKLEVSQERLAELVTLVEIVPGKIAVLDEAVSGYRKYLRDSRDMALKIIILDGAEIGLARQLEKVTRENEAVLSDILGSANQVLRVYILEALIAAQVENEDIFKFIVKNYQFTQDDIEKNKAVIDEHLKLVEEKLPLDDESKQQAVESYLGEARKFQNAGLNVEAYDWVKKAKNVAYIKISN
ncbi:MAG: hypothetical protein HY396_01255 [Candidatus Doudnabacteria bacterium]|nr:hypothetical protein [Candidatus Doudnabacteria bacterium]